MSCRADLNMSPACATAYPLFSQNTVMFIAAGSYRQLQARLRTNAESVAFYGGIEKEGTLLIRKSFSTLVAHQASLLGTQWRFSMWQVLLPKFKTCQFSSLLSDSGLHVPGLADLRWVIGLRRLSSIAAAAS